MSTVFAFGIPGGPEWIIIFVVLLLLFGAKKLPELARGIGRSLGEFRKAKDEFEHEIRFSEQELDREDTKRLEAERRRKFEESKSAKASGDSEDGKDAGDSQDSGGGEDAGESKKSKALVQSQDGGAGDSDLGDD